MERVDFQKNTIVFLLWQDSATQQGWKSGQDLEGSLCHIDTIGYVVGNNEACITVSPCLDRENNAAISPVSIPWSAVVTIEEINP